MNLVNKGIKYNNNQNILMLPLSYFDKTFKADLGHHLRIVTSIIVTFIFVIPAIFFNSTSKDFFYTATRSI